MDMFDEAVAMQGALKLSGLTQTGLAREMGVSQSYVANKLRLLSLGERVKERIKAGGVSERHARSLLRLSSEDEQLSIVEKVIARGLTVRECEALVDSISSPVFTETVGIRAKRERIERFTASLKSGLSGLSSLGINCNMRTSFHGNKTYISLMIEDDG